MSYTPKNPNGQATMANSEPVVIASDQSTIPVSVSGVATAANQTTGNTSLSNIDTDLGAPTDAASTAGSTGSLNAKARLMTSQLDAIQTATQLIDDGVATVASATPTKGMVSIGTDGTNARALKTDTNGELQVDVLTMPTVTVDSELPAAAALADAAANPTTPIVGAANLIYNGTTFDRVRGDITNGMDVDVTRVPTDPFGANADAASATGSISAKLRFIAATGIPVTSVVSGTGATNLSKARDGAAGATDTNLGVMMIRRDTPTAVTPVAGDYEIPQISANGEQWVRLAGELADDAAFTVATTRVLPVGFLADETSTDSVDEGDIGAARITLDRKQVVANYAHTAGGATPYKLNSAATTNATSVKASAGQIYSIMCTNTNAAVRYLKLYNKASAPTVGTDVPVQVYAIPGATTGGGFTLSIPVGMAFSTGIAFATTTGAADSDTGAVAANEIIVNLTWL